MKRTVRSFNAAGILPLLTVLFCLSQRAIADVRRDLAAIADPVQKRDTTTYVPYCMDSSYFSCDVPSDWSLSREEEKDKEYRIFEIFLSAPESDKVSVEIRVSYYAADNEDFVDYSDFIERNSTNILGETQNAREKYEPVMQTLLGKRTAFELVRERMEYLHPETKSDESAELKEKLFVLPAIDGFYVLHYAAPQSLFAKYLPVFDHISRSFTGRL